MSNKAFNKLNWVDQQIRRTMNLGMDDKATYLTIEFIWGFELFNTRAYHNYETWSGGYVVSDRKHMIRVQSEDLDDAIRLWVDAVIDVREGRELKPWQRLREPKPEGKEYTPGADRENA